jgi:hypothetical protein
MCIQALAVGNGDDTVYQEVYTDIVADIAPGSAATTTSSGPYGVQTWMLCSSARVTPLVPSDVIEPVVAIVRRVSAETFMSLESTVLDVASIDVVGASTSCVPASMALVGAAAAPLLVVGVNLVPLNPELEQPQALLWPVNPAPTVSTVLPWTSTGYNVGADTGAPRLPLPTAGVIGTTILRVLSTASGDVFVATLAAMDTALSLPQHAAQVYHYTASTDLDLAYGAGDGVATWYSTCADTTRPNDACLLWAPGAAGCIPAGVVVTGNAFGMPEVAAWEPAENTYVNPVDEALTVALADAPDGLPVTPEPFVIAFRGTAGTPGSLLSCALKGCAPVVFAATLCLPPGAAAGAVAATLLGDVCFHPGCPGQPAGLLVAGLALPSSGYGAARVVNAQRVSTPILCVSSTGQVSIDAKCSAATSLQVQGTVTVGCGQREADTCYAAPPPGTIRFNAETQRLQLYDGSGTWKTLAVVDPPP